MNITGKWQPVGCEAHGYLKLKQKCDGRLKNKKNKPYGPFKCGKGSIEGTTVQWEWEAAAPGNHTGQCDGNTITWENNCKWVRIEDDDSSSSSHSD